MRVEHKYFYYFDEVDKGKFTDFLWKIKSNMSDFASLCGISVSLLSQIVNGKRALTKNVIQAFNENGFKVKLK